MKVAVASSCAAIPTSRQPRRRSAAFTLVEVMVALTLITMLCLSAFAGLRLVSNLALSNSLRTEANRLMQEKSETLMAADFSGFAASAADETIPSVLKTTFAPSNAAMFAPVAGSRGRVSFTRRVVLVSSTASARTLRVEVEWNWQARSPRISTQLYRSM